VKARNSVGADAPPANDRDDRRLILVAGHAQKIADFEIER
jgi:hypothetical protein